MSLNRTRSGLASLLLLCVTGLSAVGQDMASLQIWDKNGTREPYGNWAEPPEGFFFTFDGIFWSISDPDKTTIGVADLPDELTGLTSNFNTGDFRNKWKTGNRLEGGFISGHHGVLISGFELNRQTMHLGAQGVNGVFLTPDGTGQLLNLDDVSVSNRLKPKSIEVDYIYRTHQLHHGATLEWLLGGRYFFLHDMFAVSALNTTESTDPDSGETTTTTVSSDFEMDAKNIIAGPQVGLRWWRPFGRFAISSEGRFMAGLNSISLRQRGTLDASSTTGGDTPVNPDAGSLIRNSLHLTEFTPLVELRIEGHVQITRNFSARAGWNGVYLGGIARSANMVEYRLPSLGILHQRDSVFMQGLSLGIEINR